MSGCEFNNIPTYEEQAKAKWSDVLNQYQRRSDLIPNLVETVKGYAKQESRVLEAVTAARAQATSIKVDASTITLWRDRRDLFFKPARGHGGKAVYRGSKLTRKVWVEIVAGEYVAQSYAAPSARGVLIDAAPAKLKVDARLYTFAGSVLLAAARLYQGQTTNMRTAGGGFAPLLEVRSPRQ